MIEYPEKNKISYVKNNDLVKDFGIVIPKTLDGYKLIWKDIYLYEEIEFKNTNSYQ